MVLLYSAVGVMYVAALLTSGLAFLTLSARCRSATRGGTVYAVTLSGPTLYLYGLSSLFLAVAGVTSIAVIYVGVWRLDLAAHAAASAISDVAAAYTAWSVWGPHEDGEDIKIRAV